MKKTARSLLIVVLCMMMVLSLVACGGEGGTSNPQGGQQETTQGTDADKEFVFRGKGEATNGRELNFVITGETDGTMLVTIEEMPVLSMPGHWTLEPNKGYRLYFDDGSGALAYTKYDPATGDFSFKTSINTGSYGSPTVEFTYHDEAFAASYDGVGLGRIPPVFNLYGWYGAILGWEGKVTCQEDGTFIATARVERTQSRTGTWTYDEDSDTYTLICDSGVLWANGHEITAEEWPHQRYGDTRPHELDKDVSVPLTFDDYVELNYCKGPYTTTVVKSGNTSTYTISVDFDFLMGSITVFTGDCVFED